MTMTDPGTKPVYQQPVDPSTMFFIKVAILLMRRAGVDKIEFSKEEFDRSHVDEHLVVEQNYTTEMAICEIIKCRDHSN